MECEEILVCPFVPPLNVFNIELEIIDTEISKFLHKDVILHTTREPNNQMFQEYLPEPKNMLNIE